MFKKTDDASSPSEENSARNAGLVSLERFTPLVKGAANQLTQFVQREESVPHTEDIEAMESVTGETSAESAEHDKPNPVEHANVFDSAIKTALQEYASQQQRLQQYIERTGRLTGDVDRLAGVLEETEHKRQQLLLQNKQTTKELNDKIEELTSVIRVTNEQQQRLEMAAQKEEELCSTIADYELRCQTLELRSREADALEIKIEDLNTTLATQASKINEIQAHAQALGNDNEILKQSLDEAERFRLELEEHKTQAAAEFTRKIGELTEALRIAEEQHRQLESLHSQSTTDFTSKLERLTDALQAAEEQRHQLEVRNSQSTAEFNARVGELTAALQAAEDQRQQLELQHSQATATFTARVTELSNALQASEDQRLQLETEKQRVTAEFTHRVEELTGNLQAFEDQLQQLETEKQRVTAEMSHKIEVLSGALHNSEDLRHRLAERASVADKLEEQVAGLNSEIEGLSSTLKVQADKSSDLQIRLNNVNNDNEIIKLSLEEKEALIENLETQKQQLDDAKQQVTHELTHKVDELSARLETAEAQRQQLDTEKQQLASELTRKVDELTGALQVSEDQRLQLDAEKHQVESELARKVDELTGALQVSKDQHQQLDAEKQQITSELGRKIEELSAALQDSESQRNRMSQELPREIERLSAALQESIDKRQSLEARARHADKLEAENSGLNDEIERLNSELMSQVNNIREAELKLNELNKDIEILQLAQEDKNRMLQQLESESNEQQSGLTHKIEALTTELRFTEEQNLQLRTEKDREASELTGKIAELTAALGSADEQRRQLGEQTHLAEQLNEQTSGLQQEVERLAAALQDSEQQRETLELRTRQSDELNSRTSEMQHEINRLSAALLVAEQQRETLTQRASRADDLGKRVEELNTELHHAEQQRLRLESDAGQAEQLNTRVGELQHEVERLAAALQEAEQQRDTLAQQANGAGELNKRVEELTAELYQSEQQRRQLETNAGNTEQFKDQTAGLQHEVERLAAALQEAEQQREALAQRASQADEFSERVKQLSEALHASEEQRQQLVEHSDKATALDDQTADLKEEIERLTTALQLARIQAGDTSPASDPVAPAQATVTEHTDTIHNAAAADTLAETTSGSQTGTGLSGVNSESPSGQDTLTGLLDRQGFMKKLEEGIKQFPESDQEQAVLYVLLDNFTSIREATGVAASDNIIADISRLLTSNSSPQDTIARFGDCVFTVLHHDSDVAGIQSHAEKLLHVVEDYVSEVNGQAILTTASIGICVINDYTTDPNNILNRADLACEVARSSGGNQLQIHSTIIDEQLSHENMDEWGELIRKTLDDERFYLVYQPIICLGEDLQKRYEVLLRIVDEDGKIVLPGKFMALAENLGLSREIDLWVIDSALKKLAESNDSGTQFFIKLSVNSLQDTALPRWIQDKLTAYSLNSASVVFEISESIAINNLKNAMLFTRAMRTLGCKVALEHYAAATQPQLLKHIQTDYLKIDGSLISSLPTSKESRTSVRAIVDRGKHYDLKCVAEHVDSAASLAMLWELGAAFAQGNFIQEPSKEIDYDFFGEIETHDIPHAPDYSRKPEQKSEFV